jgi:hypothetical protein
MLGKGTGDIKRRPKFNTGTHLRTIQQGEVAVSGRTPKTSMNGAYLDISTFAKQ